MSVVRKLRKHPRDTKLDDKLGEPVHKSGGGGNSAVCLAALQRPKDSLRVLREQNPMISLDIPPHTAPFNNCAPSTRDKYGVLLGYFWKTPRYTAESDTDDAPGTNESRVESGGKGVHQLSAVALELTADSFASCLA